MPYTADYREQITSEAVEKRAKGWTYAEIGDEYGVTRQTIKKWITSEYASRSEHRSTSDAREEAIAHYRAQIREAWTRLGHIKSTSYNASGFLNTARQAQERIDKLTGAEAPIKLQEVDEEYEIVWEDADSLAAAE